MLIELKNRIIVKDPPDKLKELLIYELKVSNPLYTDALSAGRSTWGINPHIYQFDVLPDDSLALPRGYRQTLFGHIKRFGLEDSLTYKDSRPKFEHFEVNSSQIVYRGYQKKAIAKLISSGEEGILRAPAGSGKTIMGLSLVPLFGFSTLWLTHTDRLAKQVMERLATFLPSLKDDDIGKIGGGKWQIGKIFTVAMIPTLVRNLDKLIEVSDNFGLVILDEAHHCPASTFLKVVGFLNPYYLYGLTATPYRRDKLENVMFNAIGRELVGIDINSVAEDGGVIIPTVKYRTVRSTPDQTNNIQAILKRLVEDKSRNNLIVGDVLREAIAGHFCIVISDRKAHCEELFELIKISHPKTGIATGDYSKKYVDEQVKRFEDGEITVLVTTFALLGEGFDVAFLDRAFVTMPFRAEAKAEQLVGRIQRTAPGKTDAVVYDYLDADIGVLTNQFHAPKRSDCRYAVYTRLGMNIEPF